jgi:hypothetical protein
VVGPQALATGDLVTDDAIPSAEEAV